MNALRASLRQISIQSIFLGLCLFAIALLTASAEEPNDSSRRQLIKPLFGSVSKEEKKKTEDQDQCAGTMRHYSFPPTGYEPRKSDSRSEKGKALYEKHNCKQCHSIRENGGQLGPPLDGIGGHRGKEWLVARLLDPETQMREFSDVFDGRPNIMPHPDVSKREANLIAEYLLTLAEPEGGYLVTSHVPTASATVKDGGFKTHPVDQSARRGAKLFMELGCASCHTTSGTRPRFGPSLKGIGARRSESELDAVLKGASANFPTMKTITVDIDADQLNDIKSFLLSLSE